MARNFVQPGNVLTLTAPSGGVVSGSGYLIGALFVVALHDAPEGSQFEGQCTGVWTLPKSGSEEWAEGEAVYWDGSQATTTAGENGAPIGHVAEVAGSGDAIGSVRLSA